MELVETELLYRRQRGVRLLTLGEWVIDVDIRQRLQPSLALEIVHQLGEQPDIETLKEDKAAMRRDGNMVISL
jgi:hypothetical protein